MVNLGLAHVMLLSLGGTLVDLLDRRKAMMALDVLGAFVTFGSMIAIERNSLVLFYVLNAALWVTGLCSTCCLRQSEDQQWKLGDPVFVLKAGCLVNTASMRWCHCIHDEWLNCQRHKAFKNLAPGSFPFVRSWCDLKVLWAICNRYLYPCSA